MNEAKIKTTISHLYKALFAKLTDLTKTFNYFNILRYFELLKYLKSKIKLILQLRDKFSLKKVAIKEVSGNVSAWMYGHWEDIKVQSLVIGHWRRA